MHNLTGTVNKQRGSKISIAINSLEPFQPIGEIAFPISEVGLRLWHTGCDNLSCRRMRGDEVGGYDEREECAHRAGSFDGQLAGIDRNE